MTGDRDWYVGESTKRGFDTPRCPFASVDRCPRYYQSLSLLGETGSTKLSNKEDKRLLKRWRKSDLWPRTAEQETAVFSSNGTPYLFAKFCPEVLFERFGWFATSLAAYPDEVDRSMAHRTLGNSNTGADDWRWAWWQMTPMHFSDCPIYSPLSHPVQQSGSEILGMKPGIWGFSVDLKALWRWLRK